MVKKILDIVTRRQQKSQTHAPKPGMPRWGKCQCKKCSSIGYLPATVGATHSVGLNVVGVHGWRIQGRGTQGQGPSEYDKNKNKLLNIIMKKYNILSEDMESTSIVDAKLRDGRIDEIIK